MKFYLDTANVNDIREAASMGIISGVTTNPSILSKEGKNYKDAIMEVAAIMDGEVFAEVLSMNADDMVKEALEMTGWCSNMIIKIPMVWEGLKAVNTLSKLGVKTAITLIYSQAQALLASQVGATYVAPFVARSFEAGQDGINLVSNIAEVFNKQGITTRIIAASLRTPIDVFNSAKAGAHILTAPYGVLKQMAFHPLTDTTLQMFLKDFQKVANL